MKHLTKKHTRKQKAMNRLLLIGILLLAYYAAFPFSLTLRQTIQTAEHNLGLSPTEVIEQKKTSHNTTLCLSANEEALLLVPFRLQPWRSWCNNGTPLKVIDLVQEPGSVHADSVYTMDRDCGMADHIFGSVDLAGAVSVKAYSRHDDPYATQVTYPSITIPLFQAENGKSYFWGTIERKSPSGVTFPDTLDILDKDGKILLSYDMHARYRVPIPYSADTP